MSSGVMEGREHPYFHAKANGIDDADSQRRIWYL